MTDQLSVIHLILEASVPVQIVLGILMLASLSSWAIIFRKRLIIGRARRNADHFENSFWSGGDLAQLYRTIEARGGATGMASIFEFGFREFARQRQQGGTPPDQLLEGARRAMRVAQLRRSIASSTAWRLWLPSAPPVRTSACSARSGAS